MLKSQQGSAALLVVIGVLAVALAGIKFLGQRTEKEYRVETRQEIMVDKLKVKSAFQANTDCSLIDFLTPCTLGATIAVSKLSGGILAAANSSTVIGKWNVKVECLAKAPNAFWIMVAKPNGNGGFHPDPLTQQPLAWKELFALQDVCKTTGANQLLIASDPCFGAAEGSSPIPPEVLAQIDCSAGCPYADNFCSDTQREFPACPTGYQTFFRYVDRFGWGGVDFAKYTYCTRI